MNEQLNLFDGLNKLFLSFCSVENLDLTIENITKYYSILYNKIFVLESEDSEELICTYNIDTGNISEFIIPNTILVHRKKESNSLYSINALNALIMELNNGKLDKNYKINWKDYQNTILLIQDNNLRKLHTKIYKIINL